MRICKKTDKNIVKNIDHNQAKVKCYKNSLDKYQLAKIQKQQEEEMVIILSYVEKVVYEEKELY